MAKQSTATKVVEGLSVAALATAAAAAYFFTGPEGKKNKAKARAWASAAKKDMLVKIKHMKTVSQKAYQQAAREVMAKYKRAKNIEPAELRAFGAELKKHWEKIAMDVKKMGRVKPAAKKAASKRR